MVHDYINDYEVACNNLVAFFAEKYDVSVGAGDWVAGIVGGTICINEEFYVNMDDIVLMLKNEVSWDYFLEYWDYNMDASHLGLNPINLRSWIMVAPRLTDEQINGLKEKRKELQALVRQVQKRLLTCYGNTNGTCKQKT